MHRSGTSAVAGCLQRLGVEFGPRLMPATADNERGYYEHIDVVNLHDRLLMTLDRGWDSTTPFPERWWEGEAAAGRFHAELLGLLRRDYGTSALWSIKDPRMCRLLPWWQPLWPALETEPIFLIVVRDPNEVAMSLARREGISPTKSYLLWLQHLLDAERATRGHRRHFLSFHHFMEDWAGSLAPLERFLGERWKEFLLAGQQANENFLDRRLLRASSAGSKPASLPAWLDEAAALFTSACGGHGDGFEQRMPRLLQEAVLDQRREDRPAAEQAGDAAIELAAARKLARWYEAEWQKARHKADDYKQRWQERKGPGNQERSG